MRKFWEAGLGDAGEGSKRDPICLRELIEIEAFYLTGGTALSAFYLNHRKSNDLDFFTSTEELILPFSYKIEEALKAKGLKIDSLIDIASNKLLTLFGRATLRNFIDVYFLIKEKFSKSELIEKTRIKDPGFDLYWLGVAFERINEFTPDSPEMLLLVKRCSLEDLQRFFNGWRGEIYGEIGR